MSFYIPPNLCCYTEQEKLLGLGLSYIFQKLKPRYDQLERQSEHQWSVLNSITRARSTEDMVRQSPLEVVNPTSSLTEDYSGTEPQE